MTLQQWFTKNTKTPLAVLGAFLTLIYFFFAFYAIRIHQEHQYSNFRDLIVTTVNIGIQQSNRELIESAFARSVNNLGAKSAFLCKENSILISTALNETSCLNVPKSNFFDRTLKFNMSGFSDYKIYFVAPKYSIQGTYYWVLIATFLVFIASAWIIFRVRKKFIEDILLPLEGILLSNEETVISDFQKIRLKIKELSENKEKEAFDDAIFESKKAFSHNVKSPLRNLKLIREKFNKMFDLEDLDLFDSAVNQISSMAEKLNVKTSQRSRVSRIALFDIGELVSKCIKEKTHEWSNIGSKITLCLDSKIGSHAFSSIECAEMHSILSNILNNSMDAGATHIELKMSVTDSIILDVIDNGNGVLETLKDSIFTEGTTYGKLNGTGYGLFHARKFLSNWNGSINLVESKKGFTHFRLCLPLWDTPQLTIPNTDTVAIIDDKPIEISRIKKSIDSSGKIKNKVISFNSPENFLDWYNKKPSAESVTVLADYDMGKRSINGVDLIKSLNLSTQSLLVTDNYEDERLYSTCKKFGISMVPKSCIERLVLLQN